MHRRTTGLAALATAIAGGKALLVFTDGELRLHRSSSASCFSFPTIQNTDRWVVGGGNRRVRRRIRFAYAHAHRQ